jgi:hypothetical protein
MWNVNTSSCLQQLSNSIVDATSQFISPNQSVPGWVLNLPEPIRSEKIGTSLLNFFLNILMLTNMQLSFKSMARQMCSTSFSPSTSICLSRWSGASPFPLNAKRFTQCDHALGPRRHKRGAGNCVYARNTVIKLVSSAFGSGSSWTLRNCPSRPGVLYL